jgi:tetratricopeptide (TPR) repeat protein
VVKTTKSVRVREEPLAIPTYSPCPPEKLPMFLEKRVYQGSSGKVYPNPFTDRVSDQPKNVAYNAIFLENEYISLIILPEIGGRIYQARDKTNGYDFFYKQSVIKPALVGLLGPWISGGVEFNWPQHHRPSTYSPVDSYIEEHNDGSCTVWLSEHEPMNRMKGMVGICLRPGSSVIEAKVRLYNRTPLVQTFLWWANVAVRVHEDYQSFFPPDVRFVADHAKRAVSHFPIARNYYYGVDYTKGVDLTWYKNIPVPTSYMVTASDYDFFGGYDHAKRAGFVHVADRFISPGKKQWTWGNAEFGYAWDRELTDSDGPYIELMAGVYTDNQPDFSFLTPYETKTFSQFWYPIREIGPAKNANRLLAVNLERKENVWRVGICASNAIHDATVLIESGKKQLLKRTINLEPEHAFLEAVPVGASNDALRLTVFDKAGVELIRYTANAVESDEKLPPPAKEPFSPAHIKTVEELYLTGVHLEQYRHATRAPEPYWREALRRDSGDARTNNALGLSLLRQGCFEQAEAHFKSAIERLTLLNPNPRDGEPFYNLGLALSFQNQNEEAYANFYKATWNAAWRSAGYYAVATIDCRRSDFERALTHLELCLRTGNDNLKARDLKAAILRKLNRIDQARMIAKETIQLDPLDLFARNEAHLAKRTESDETPFLRLHADPQSCLDVALDYAQAGFWQDGDDLLDLYLSQLGEESAGPMFWYARANFSECLSKYPEAARFRERARAASPDYCFPSRLEELLLLKAALEHDPEDARAHYYLGNLLYDKLRREEAIHEWEQAAQLEPTLPIPWRNLGLAYFNVHGDEERALKSYERARLADPGDARLFYEYDQLRKRSGALPQERLADLEAHRELVKERDDLTVELVTLYNRLDEHEKALAILNNRRFHPWEGGEGSVSNQYAMAHFQLGLHALDSGKAKEALYHFETGRTYPANLGEGKHLLTPELHFDFYEGIALAKLNQVAEAKAAWTRAAEADQRRNAAAYFKGCSLRELGKEEAVAIFEELFCAAEELMREEAKIDYFATSLPNFLLFEDDLQRRQRIEGLFLRGLARRGLGHNEEAMEDFRTVLDLDVNHIWAHIELQQ